MLCYEHGGQISNSRFRVHTALHVPFYLHEIRSHFHWFNSLWSGNAIWRQGSGSTLTQCLMAPSHYLKQCWFLRHSHEGNFTVNAQVTILYNEFEYNTLKIPVTSPGGQWIKCCTDEPRDYLQRRIARIMQGPNYTHLIDIWSHWLKIIWEK